MDYNLLRHISSICNQLPAMSSDKFESSFTQVCLNTSTCQAANVH